MTRTMKAVDFTVGWVCALPIELAAAAEMMDEVYEDIPEPPPPPTDTNNYTYGRVGKHKVIAACLPAGQVGTNQAAHVASQLRSSFPAVRFGLLVGIGGGVPSEDHDIRLGDVVISQPTGQHGGVVQFDLGKTGPDGRIVRTGCLNAPPAVLLTALAKLRANDLRGKTAIPLHLSKASANQKFACTIPDKDTLFAASSQHSTGPTCAKCSPEDVVVRETREKQGPVLFFGNIASGNQVMKDGPTRDSTSDDLGGILCFEMEAAGLMNNLPCLVIRGICDYADSHKNKQWHPYAAVTSAACAKELLSIVPRFGAAMDAPDSSGRKSHFIVPFGRNHSFIGRDDILEQLMLRVVPSADEEDCQRMAVEGLGGIGKTQVALEIAYRVRRADPDCSVFWMPAVTAALFEDACRTIGQTLKLPAIDDDKVDVKSLVKKALERSTYKWLLIIDNADDADWLSRGPGGYQLHDYLPFNRRGSILFTTRNHGAVLGLGVRPKNVFNVTGLSEDEAIRMLQEDLKPDQRSDDASTKALVQILSYLPLAIKQASAFMAETGLSTTKYLSHYQRSDKNQIKLLSWDFEDQGRYRQIRNPIATTWLISFEKLSERHPLAVRYLKCICFLAEKDIPVSMLPVGGEEKNRSDKHKDDERNYENDGDGDDDEWALEKDAALGALEGYAFIIRRQDSDSFDIHRLVRLAMRNWVKQEEPEQIRMVIQHLSRIYPSPCHENRGLWLGYMPHVEAALESWTQTDTQSEQWKLVFNSGESHFILGKYGPAEERYRRAISMTEEVLGPEHPSTLDNMTHLADVLRHQGRYEEAEAMHRKTLALKIQVLGREHLLTFDSMNHLANVLDRLGKYEEGEALHKKVLASRERMLGLENPSTLSSMSNVALILNNQGKYEEAEAMCKKTITLKEQVLGLKHPSVLGSMNNLGFILKNQKKYAEAEASDEKTVALHEQVLGKEHPSTLDSKSNLAGTLRVLGKYKEAEAMGRQTLALREQVLGPEHPSTLKSMNNLAATFRYQEKYEEAEAMLKKTVELKERTLGLKNPSTLESICNLAEVLGTQGKFEEAAAMHKKTLALREDLLGQEHPSTRQSRDNLLSILEKRKKHARGAAL